MPKLTLFMIVVMVAVFWWFARGGSFRLYASMFFGLYDLTGIVWLSIILVSVVQNIVFLPLQIIGARMWPKVREFESELEKSKTDDQYFLFQKKIHTGDSPVIFYVLNFVLLAIAFISAGRVFLLDFYNEHIHLKYLYDWIPYPQYPLKGTIFYFPWFKINSTMAMDWNFIFRIWLYVIAFMVFWRLVWLLAKFFLKKNLTILKIRIRYNQLLVAIGGVMGTVLIVSTFVLRHIPTSVSYVTLVADLAKQNTAFNIITAVATFFAAIHSGHKHNKEGAEEAKKEGIPKEIIDRVYREAMKVTYRNGLLLAGFAYAVTHQMPCSHDLSVLAFEAIYVMSPLWMGLLTKRSNPSPASAGTPLEEREI
ncbi:hypothetical protein KBC75_05235 [Candidatus Shapirobacteria bacterium]|nr:hypothetical protein [Candidatus Shapirobacteria bacterium]